MAAVVRVTAQKPESEFATDSLGWKYRRIGILLVTTSADTYDASAGPPIQRIAWEPIATDDPIAVTHAAGIVTFTGTSGSTGYLHIWTSS